MLQNWRQLEDAVLHVRPKVVGSHLDMFAWDCDGSLINSTRAFVLSAMALFTTVGQWQQLVPREVLNLLGCIKCKYLKFEMGKHELWPA